MIEIARAKHGIRAGVLALRIKAVEKRPRLTKLLKRFETNESRGEIDGTAAPCWVFSKGRMPGSVTLAMPGDVFCPRCVLMH